MTLVSYTESENICMNVTKTPKERTNRKRKRVVDEPAETKRQKIQIRTNRDGTIRNRKQYEQKTPASSGYAKKLFRILAKNEGKLFLFFVDEFKFL